MAVRDLGYLARRLRTIAIEVPDKADELIRKVAIAIDQVLVTETPVDSGNARSNWIPSFNAPVLSPRIGIGPSPAPLMAEMQAKVATYDGDIHRSIHLSNNVVYINRLNDGWSKQAPAGFVQAAVMKGVGAVYGVSLID